MLQLADQWHSTAVPPATQGVTATGHTMAVTTTMSCRKEVNFPPLLAAGGAVLPNEPKPHITYQQWNSSPVTVRHWWRLQHQPHKTNHLTADHLLNSLHLYIVFSFFTPSWSKELRTYLILCYVEHDCGGSSCMGCGSACGLLFGGQGGSAALPASWPQHNAEVPSNNQWCSDVMAVNHVTLMCKILSLCSKEKYWICHTLCTHFIHTRSYLLRFGDPAPQSYTTYSAYSKLAYLEEPLNINHAELFTYLYLDDTGSSLSTQT